MFGRRVKSLLVAGFSVFLVSFFNPVLAQEDSAHKEAKNSFDAKEIIFGHVLNNHDFHIIDIVHDDGSNTSDIYSSSCYPLFKTKGVDSLYVIQVSSWGAEL